MPLRAPTRPKAPSQILSLELRGGLVEVALRRSDRARLIRLTVDPRGRVTLVVPRRTSRRLAEGVLAERAGWLERQLARIEARRAAPRALAAGPGWLPLAGGAIAVERRPDETARVREVGGRLLLGGDEDAAAAALERWYRREARRRLEAAVAVHAPRVGVRPSRIAVRDQRTRWGSCSRSGTLSFSWRLVLAPPDALEYVVVHELCHLHEHSHRPRFWRLVETHWPGYRAQSAWLREHGEELAAFDPKDVL
jgi:predicted metal-dependent hydrolase